MPIPGKWQPILNSLIDLERGNFKISEKTTGDISNLKGKRKGYSHLLMALVEQLTGKSSSLSPLKYINKHGSASSSAAVAAEAAAAAATSQLELKNIKKLTRQAAAKYARRLISQTPIGASNSGKKSINGELAKVLAKATHRKSAPEAVGNSAAAVVNQTNRSSKNDYLVTLFNLVKLFRQIKELDHTKLFDLNKKSSIFFNHKSSNKQAPMLSMNINNRKSLMNKMNYIHKLTTDLNYRNRIFT